MGSPALPNCMARTSHLSFWALASSAVTQGWLAACKDTPVCLTFFFHPFPSGPQGGWGLIWMNQGLVTWPSGEWCGLTLWIIVIPLNCKFSGASNSTQVPSYSALRWKKARPALGLERSHFPPCLSCYLVLFCFASASLHSAGEQRAENWVWLGGKHHERALAYFSPCSLWPVIKSSKQPNLAPTTGVRSESLMLAKVWVSLWLDPSTWPWGQQQCNTELLESSI